MEQNLEQKELPSRIKNRRNYGAEPRIQGMMEHNLEQKELWSRTWNTRNYRAKLRMQGIMKQNSEKINYYGAEP